MRSTTSARLVKCRSTHAALRAPAPPAMKDESYTIERKPIRTELVELSWLLAVAVQHWVFGSPVTTAVLLVGIVPVVVMCFLSRRAERKAEAQRDAQRVEEMLAEVDRMARARFYLGMLGNGRATATQSPYGPTNTGVGQGVAHA